MDVHEEVQAILKSCKMFRVA